MKRKVRVCFISLNSYPLFVKNSCGYFGGAEVQMSYLAKAFSEDEGFEVSLVVGDYNQKKIEKKSNITLYRCFDKENYGLVSVFRFIKTLWTIRADVYIDRTMGPKLGLLSMFGKIFRKKIVYMVAHDWDCSFKFKSYLRGVTKWLYYWGIKNVDLVISQKLSQQRSLINFFKVNSVVIKSVINTIKQKSEKRKYILWVGRADKWKQPEKMIKLAKHLKSESIVMICRQGVDLNYFNWINKLAQVESNVVFLSAVSFDQIGKYYQQAKVLVNTSIAEGFSNTFLQAGVAKTPVLSLIVNPNQYLSKNNCGLTAGNQLTRMISLCNRLLKDSRKLKIMGENHYLYIKKNHSLKNINKFKKIICELLSFA